MVVMESFKTSSTMNWNDSVKYITSWKYKEIKENKIHAKVNVKIHRSMHIKSILIFLITYHKTQIYCDLKEHPPIIWATTPYLIPPIGRCTFACLYTMCLIQSVCCTLWERIPILILKFLIGLIMAAHRLSF